MRTPGGRHDGDEVSNAQAGDPASSSIAARGLELRRKDGGIITVESVASTIRSSDKPLHAAILRDVSDRVHAQEAMEQAGRAELRIAHERVRMAFEDAPIGMVVADLSGRLLEVNRMFCTMLGRTEPELLQLTVNDITDPEDVTNSADLLVLMASGAIDSRQIFKHYRHADGRSVPAVVSVSVIRGDDGAPRFLVAQAQDMTERLRMQTAFAQQQTFMAAVLENLDSGVVACDDKGGLTVLNRAGRQMLPGHEVVAGLEEWSEYFGLYRADGISLLPMEDMPLYRALQGEVVRDFEFVIASPARPPRTVIAHGHAINDDDGILLGAVVALHDVTERRAAEAAVDRQAMHDPLTDLANMVLLSDRIQHAQSRRVRNPAPMALLTLGLDDFKKINGSRGHIVGDTVLGVIAKRLRACLRPEDTIARVGGDEFAALLERTSQEDAMAIAAEVLDVVREPIDIDGRPVGISASIGVVVCNAADHDEQLLRKANLAMQAAKGQNKAKVQIFTSTMHEEVVEQISLENHLRQAVDRGKLTVHYQPIVSLITGRLDGFEALARWNHPSRGPISPTTFIPLAESTGLIVPLGEWILREACRQARYWQRKHPDTARLTMSVNLSVRQLHDPSITHAVAAALADADLAPDRLMLEVTESGIMHRGEARATVDQLQASGVRMAIDDSGPATLP